MFIKASTLVLGTVLGLAALQPALAESLRQDIREDIATVRRDRKAVIADEARVARERAELQSAIAREHQDFRSGHFIRGLREAAEKRKETRELAQANSKLAADRAKLARDRQDLHEDFERVHRN